MPYFSWRGVDITGKKRKGTVCAQTPEQVDAILLRREIALIACKPVWYSFVRTPVRLSHTIRIMRHLSMLLQAGVLLPQALYLIAQQIHHATLQESMYAIADQVHAGSALSDILGEYPRYWRPLVIQLIRVGEESGTLAHTLDTVATYLESEQDFYKKLRSALFIPVITLIFFVCVCFFIFFYLVPHIGGLFSFMHHDIPASTRFLIQMSTQLQEWAYGIVLSLIGVFLLGYYFFRTARGRRCKMKILIRIPGIHSLMHQRFVAHWFESIAILLEGGLRLVPALQSIQPTLAQSPYAPYTQQVLRMVEEGNSLSEALVSCVQLKINPDIIAMIRVAEESHTIPVMLKHVAMLLHERVQKKLSICTLCLQPAIIIILGLLIAFLIFALYVPLFDLASAL